MFKEEQTIEGIIEPSENQLSEELRLHRPKLTKEETMLYFRIIDGIKENPSLIQIAITPFVRYWNCSYETANRRVKKTVETMLGKLYQLYYGKEEETKKKKSSMISYLYQYSSSIDGRVAYLQISSVFEEPLRQIKTKYDEHTLKMILQLKEEPVIRIYEALKQSEKNGYWNILLRDLPSFLESDSLYSELWEIKRYVLDSAKKEINSTTDLWVDYTILGRGEQMSIHFTIKSNPRKDRQEKR